MAFKQKLTLIIDGFTYSSKPIICEFPQVKTHIFNKMRRVIRTVFGARAHSDLSLNRSHEGLESRDHYTLQIRSYSLADLQQIVSDLRTGFAALNPSDEFYSWSSLKSEELDLGDGVYLSKATVPARRDGKVRE